MRILIFTILFCMTPGRAAAECAALLMSDGEISAGTMVTIDSFKTTASSAPMDEDRCAEVVKSPPEIVGKWARSYLKAPRILLKKDFTDIPPVQRIWIGPPKGYQAVTLLVKVAKTEEMLFRPGKLVRVTDVSKKSPICNKASILSLEHSSDSIAKITLLVTDAEAIALNPNTKPGAISEFKVEIVGDITTKSSGQ